MRLGIGAINELDDERLTFARQLGIENLIVHAPTRHLPGSTRWELDDLVAMRQRVESAGLKLYAIENLPREFYDKIRMDLPGREEQIENVCETIRNIGRAGIPVLGYDFNLAGVWRTERSPTGRGEAHVTIYDHAQAQRAPTFPHGEFDDEAMWRNYTYFLEGVVPAAAEAGVMLALHPDDPPVPSIAGTARIFRSSEAYKRVIDIVDSPANGLEFCQGTVSEWCRTGDEVIELIRYLVTRKKIAYVHFRNTRGVAEERFEETFIEEGKVDMLAAMRAYKECDFDGVFIVDHTPGIVGDTGWGHRGRAYGVGYIKGLLKCVGVS